MKTIFVSGVIALLMALTVTAQVSNERKRCDLNYVDGDVYYHNSPGGKVRKVVTTGGLVIESTRRFAKTNWAEVSHLTRTARERLGWIQERFLKNCIPYKQLPVEDEWFSFYSRFKSAVESRDRRRLEVFLPAKIYCQSWDICEFTDGEVQATQDLIFRKLNEKRGQRWAILKETLNSGKFEGGVGSDDQGIENGGTRITLHRRTDENGRGYGFELIFSFENGKWFVETFHYNQISGAG